MTNVQRHVTVQGVRLRFAASHMATLGDELEPLHGHNYVVRCRVDGLLQLMDRLPADAGRGIVLRLMVMAELLTYKLEIPQEGRLRFALPGEGREMHIVSSTQSPADVQHVVAQILNVPEALITCEVRRLGGGFGGKETQPALFAAAAAVLARHTGCPVKLRPDRDDDILITGKRHDFRIDYEVGFDAQGRILGAGPDRWAAP